MKNITIVGSLNMDLVISAPYMPKGGETLTGSGFLTNCGGKGANQATACGKLGGLVKMCGCVGDDGFGSTLIEELNKSGVNTEDVRIVKNTPSGIAVIVVTDGENRIILDKGANGKLSIEDISKAISKTKNGDLYLTQLENPVEVIGEGLKLAKEKGLYTILNPAPANLEITKYFQYVDLIVPNESELELFGGIEKLKECGIKEIIVTLGSKGYAYYGEKESFSGDCIKIKAVDTTGAGDTFCGALITEMSQGASLKQALSFASKCASLACTKKGAQQSIPTRAEVEKYV